MSKEAGAGAGEQQKQAGRRVYKFIAVMGVEASLVIDGESSLLFLRIKAEYFHLCGGYAIRHCDCVGN